MDRLRENRYVERIFPSSIHFTEEFKRYFYEKHSSGISARDILLEHELAYTRQEVEFLKKLQLADMEARKQWKSRHQPK